MFFLAIFSASAAYAVENIPGEYSKTWSFSDSANGKGYFTKIGGKFTFGGVLTGDKVETIGLEYFSGTDFRAVWCGKDKKTERADTWKTSISKVTGTLWEATWYRIHEYKIKVNNSLEIINGVKVTR